MPVYGVIFIYNFLSLPECKVNLITNSVQGQTLDYHRLLTNDSVIIGDKSFKFCIITASLLAQGVVLCHVCGMPAACKCLHDQALQLFIEMTSEVRE